MDTVEGEEEIRSMRLEELAAVAGALEAGLPRDEVLADAGLSAAAWEVERERWMSRLAAQAAQGQLGTSRRYLELVAAQKRRAEEKARRARRKLEGPMPVAPAARIAPLQGAPRDGATPLPASGVSDEGAARSPWAKSSSVAPPPPGIVQPSPLPPLPDVPPPPVPAPTPILTPPSTTPRSRMTLLGTTGVPTRDALPFRQDVSSAPAVEGTATSAPLDTALPFSHTAPVPPLDTALPFSRPASSIPANNALPFSRPASSTPANNALPFSRPASSSSPPADNALPFARPAQSPASSEPVRGEITPQPSQIQTGRWALPFLQPSSVLDPPASTSLSEPATQAHAGAEDEETMRRVERISLARYARLCADLRDHPNHIPQIQSHYGLTPQSWIALHRVWNERFQSDPALKAQWQALVDQSARS